MPSPKDILAGVILALVAAAACVSGRCAIDEAGAQPPQLKSARQLVWSDYAQEEFGADYGVCSLRIGQLTDVRGPFTPGQCLRFNAGGTAFEGGQCGTGSGGQTTLGASQTALFQVPALATTTLTAATPNVPVFHNIASFTGAGIAGTLTQSAVSSVARVTAAQAGYVNIHYFDELQINTSSAGGSGMDAELVLMLTHYDSDGASLREWAWEHPITDPITASLKMLIDVTTGITPVSAGDYFTLNFAFNSATAGRNVRFELPADNPGLDERLEFFYFPTMSASGGTGFDFNSASADASASWLFPVEQKPLTAALNFTTATCPTSDWGAACYSSETGATAGSVAGVNGGAIPPDIVLQSNTRVAYASVTDKRAVRVWIGSAAYAVDAIAHTGRLGSRDVVYSTLKTPLPGTSWQGVRYEFSDGTFQPATTGTGAQRTADKALLIRYLGLEEFSPTIDNIYPTAKALLRAGDHVGIAADDARKTLTISAESGELVALDAQPTDLSGYAHNQVLRVNNPPPGKWLEVTGADAGERHLFRMKGAADPGNANDWGYSATGDIYGSLQTWDGGANIQGSETPVMRFEVQRDASLQTTAYNIVLLIRKAALATAPARLWFRVYEGELGTPNYVLATGIFNRQADNPAHTYHSYQLESGSDAGEAVWEDRQYVRGFGLFTANPAQGNDTANGLALHESKKVTEIDAPGFIPSRTTFPDASAEGAPQRFLLTRDIAAVAGTPGRNPSMTLATNDGGSHYYYSDGQSDHNSGQTAGSKDAAITNISFMRTSANQWRIAVAKRASDNVETPAEIWLKGLQGQTVYISNDSVDVSATVGNNFIAGDSTQGALLLVSVSSSTISRFAPAILSENPFRINFSPDDGATFAFAQSASTPGSPERKRGEYHLINGAYVRIGAGGTAENETGATIKMKLEDLSGEDRLSVLSLKDRLIASLPAWISQVIGVKTTVVSGTDTLAELTKTGAIPPRSAFALIGDVMSGIIFGGYSGSVLLSDMWRYEASGNSVTLTEQTKVGTIPNLSAFGMAGTPDIGVVYGGFTGRQNVNVFYGYVVQGGRVTWRTLTAAGDAITARHGVGMVGNALSGLIFGGNSGSITNDFYKYEVAQNTITLTKLTATGATEARNQMGMVGNVNSGVIFGGEVGGGYSNDFIKYEVSGNNVTMTRLANTGSPISAREKLGMGGDQTEGVIYGGFDGATRLNDWYKYLVAENEVRITAITPTGVTALASQYPEIGGSAAQGVMFGGDGGTSRLSNFYKYEFGSSARIDGILLAPTPRRVTALPAAGEEGEEVWLEADWSYDKGFDITPVPFLNTPIGGEGFGSRGYYEDPAQNYDVGQVNPKFTGDLANVWLISDTFVLVKTGTLANLTHIAYGDTECALTRGMTNQAISGPDQRRADQYGIAPSCVPSGDWDRVRFKVTGGTYIPASVTYLKGLYERASDDWNAVEPRGEEINDRIDDRVDSWARKDSSDKIPASALPSGVGSDGVQPWARNPKPAGGQYFPADQICQELATTAAYNALAVKAANRLYCVPEAQ